MSTNNSKSNINHPQTTTISLEVDRNGIINDINLDLQFEVIGKDIYNLKSTSFLALLETGNLKLNSPAELETLLYDSKPIIVKYGNYNLRLSEICLINEHWKISLHILPDSKIFQQSALIEEISNLIPGAFFKLKISTNNKLIIDYVTSGIRDITGFDQGHYQHSEFKYFILNEDYEQLTKLFKSKASINESFQLEFRTYHKNGQILWVEARAKYQIDKFGIISCTGSIVDITLRKNFEERFKNSRETLTKFFELSYDAYWDWDLLNDSCFYSSGYTKLFGYDVDSPQFHYSNWRVRIHPEDINDLEFVLDEAINNLAKPDTWTLEYRYLNVHGVYKKVKAKGLVIRNNEKVAIRMIGIISDVTDFCDLKTKLSNALIEINQISREKSEIQEQIALRNTECESFFNNSPIPKIIYNKLTLKISRVNQAAIKLYGYSSEQFQKMKISSFTNPCNEDFKSIVNLNALRYNIKSPREIYEQVDQKGRKLYVELHENSIDNKQLLMVSVLDISEYIFFQKKITQQQEALKKIAWLQSHKVRAPLANIMGLAELISHDNELIKQLKYINLIQESAAKLDGALREALDVTSNDINEALLNI